MEPIWSSEIMTLNYDAHDTHNYNMEREVIKAVFFYGRRKWRHRGHLRQRWPSLHLADLCDQFCGSWNGHLYWCFVLSQRGR